MFQVNRFEIGRSEGQGASRTRRMNLKRLGGDVGKAARSKRQDVRCKVACVKAFPDPRTNDQ